MLVNAPGVLDSALVIRWLGAGLVADAPSLNREAGGSSRFVPFLFRTLVHV